MQQVSVTDARSRFSEIVDQVRYGSDAVVLTKSGKPVAAVVPLHVYEQWARRRRKFEDILEVLRLRGEEAGVTEEEIMALAVEEVHEARRQLAASRGE